MHQDWTKKLASILRPMASMKAEQAYGMIDANPVESFQKGMATGRTHLARQILTAGGVDFINPDAPPKEEPARVMSEELKKLLIHNARSPCSKEIDKHCSPSVAYDRGAADEGGRVARIVLRDLGVRFADRQFPTQEG